MIQLGRRWPELSWKIFKTHCRDWPLSPIHLFSTLFSVLVHPPPYFQSRDSIKTLRDWMFDLLVTMATTASSQVQFFNFQNTIAKLFCPFTVLECPRHFCTAKIALTSKSQNEWHVRTWKQRGGGRRTNPCPSPSARLRWYHAAVEKPALTPDSTAADVNL